VPIFVPGIFISNPEGPLRSGQTSRDRGLIFRRAIVKRTKILFRNSAMPSLEDSLASYIKAKLRDATEVRVEQLEQISGGASRQTYRFRLSYRESGFPHERRLVASESVLSTWFSLLYEIASGSIGATMIWCQAVSSPRNQSAFEDRART
jgi:hypothetical protein